LFILIFHIYKKYTSNENRYIMTMRYNKQSKGFEITQERIDVINTAM